MAKKPYGPKKMIERLTEVRRKLGMGEGSHFSPHFGSAEALPKEFREGGAAEFIRERTRLWRETWILPVLDEVIEALENKR